MSRVPAPLLKRLLATAALLAASGGVLVWDSQRVPAEVVLAMDLGAHYESGGRHIGKPYIDKIGRGQPWTVCNGLTGPEVNPARYYTPADCRRLELPRYRQARADAAGMFVHWPAYNAWVRASIIDMIYNLGADAVRNSTLRGLANAGDLTGACEQMPRWVYGTVRGQRVRLNGLIDRRGTTRELCAEWGRDGHFSAEPMEAAQ